MSSPNQPKPAAPKPETQQPHPVPPGPLTGPPPVQLPTAPAATSPTAGLCGAPHTYKNRSGDEKVKPCIKAKGHTGPHSSRAVTQKVDLTVLKGIELDAEDVPTAEILDVVTERVRSADQLRVDANVAAGHKKWVEAGKPTGFNDAIKKSAASRYIIAPEQVAAVRTLLRRAENAPELKGKVHVKIAPAKQHVSGNSMLYFVVVDKSTRETPATQPTGSAPAVSSAAPGGKR